MPTRNQPTKGQKGFKSFITQHLAACYATIINKSQLPDQWTPELVVIDGMFLIHVKPFGRNTTFADYVKFLLGRFVQPHLKKGTKEVHILFNKSPQSNFNPKQWEQETRDEGQKQHIFMTPITQPRYHPTGKISLLVVSTNKLVLEMLAFIPTIMNCTDQKLIIAGPTYPKTMVGTIKNTNSRLLWSEEAFQRVCSTWIFAWARFPAHPRQACCKDREMGVRQHGRLVDRQPGTHP